MVPVTVTTKEPVGTYCEILASCHFFFVFLEKSAERRTGDATGQAVPLVRCQCTTAVKLVGGAIVLLPLPNS